VVHGSSIAPAGSASVSVTVLPLVTVVEVPTSVPLDVTPNPCAVSSPCVNTGVCHSVVARNVSTLVRAPAIGSFYVSLHSTTYAPSCSCPATQPQFYGTPCNFAIVGCPGCTAPFQGGAALRLYNIGLASAVSMLIARGDGTVGAALDQLTGLGIAVDNLDALTFIAPALINGSLVTQDQTK
jgi:hypothetical protein